MIHQILKKLEEKKIAILGFGREGKTTYNLIRTYQKEFPLTILDQNIDLLKDEKLKNDKFTTIIVGKNYLSDLEQYDYIIKSPGISLKNKKINSEKITSQMELFLEVAKSHTIGITGTKGKSTTSSLIYEMIKKQNTNVALIGNIGVPIFSLIEQFNEQTIFIIEMSSHQLEYLNVSPHISIVLNLYEDHIDHAGSLKHYYECKMNIFRFQTKEDIMIYSSDDDNLRNEVQKGHFLARPYTIDMKNQKADIYQKEDQIFYHETPIYNINLKRKLQGEHNLKNIMFALLVGKLLNLQQQEVLKVIENFKPLPYRLEKIAKKNKITYYVDVLATIPEATINSIETIKDVNTLIFGGMDRGISYEKLIQYLKKSKIEHFICMPTTGHKIAKYLPKEKVFLVNTLEEAVEIANQITKEEMICLLSPAAASYEQFKDYREKAEKFKEYISKIEN